MALPATVSILRFLLLLAATGVWCRQEAEAVAASGTSNGAHLRRQGKHKGKPARHAHDSDQRGDPEISHHHRHPHPLPHGHGLLEDFSLVDTRDYRHDAKSFLEAQAGQENAQCNLPRQSLAKAEHTWHRILKDLGATPGNYKKHPWAGLKTEEADHSLLGRARERFAREAFHRGPGLLNGVAAQWPAMRRWGETELRKRLTKVPFSLQSFDSEHWLKDASTARLPEKFSEYMDENRSAQDIFLFVDEPEMPKDMAGIRAVDILRKDFMPHPVFAASAEEKHAVLALDGAGSSHGFHKHAPVWQTQVAGRKVWWLLPPSVKSEGNGRGVPVVNGKQYSHPNACAFLRQESPPPGSHMCVMNPGETLVLPENWWHATCGMDRHTAAVGGWLLDRRQFPEEDENDEPENDDEREFGEPDEAEDLQDDNPESSSAEVAVDASGSIISKNGHRPTMRRHALSFDDSAEEQTRDE